MAGVDGGRARRHRRPTLDDVAVAAGVSRNTVSLTLQGSSRVRSQTAERVWAAVRATGYWVNQAARTLASGRARTLGVMHFDPDGYESTPFYFPILAGIASSATQRGYDTLLLAPRDRAGPDWLVEIGRSGRVDGLVFLGAQTDRQGIAALAAHGLPMAHVGRREIPGHALPYVAPDATGGIAAATRHLIEVHGHRRIAFFAIDLELETHRDRLAGYRLALHEASLKVDESLVLTGRRWLDDETLTLPGPPLATALVISDGFGWPLERRLRAAGWRIPEDIAVVVQDDAGGGGYRDPPLTGIVVPAGELGRSAAQLVIEHIEGTATTDHVLVTPRLAIRRSCGCPPPDGDPARP